MPSKERKKQESYPRVRKIGGSPDRQECFQDYYRSDVKLSQQRSAASSKSSYNKDIDKSREAAAVRSKRCYDKDIDKSREATAVRSKKSYDNDNNKSREATTATRGLKVCMIRMSRLADDLRITGMEIQLYFVYLTCMSSMFTCHLFYRYALRSPNDTTLNMYVTNVNKSLIMDKETNECLVAKFNNAYHTLAAEMAPKLKVTTACRLVSKKLVCENIVLQRKAVSEFLSTIRGINKKNIGINTFDDGQHTTASEPYFFDTAYEALPAIYTTVVDRDKRCITSIKKPYVSENEAKLNSPIIVYSSGICLLDGAEDIHPKTWKCHSICKTLSEAEKL